MARDIKHLAQDIRAKIESVGYREACLIVDSVIDVMEDVIPTDTWRLIDSGFGYVNGALVKESDQGRSWNRLDVVQPPNPPSHGSAGHYDIAIIYHTPKPWKKGPKGVFDYAPYVLEPPGSYHGYVKTAMFRSHRASALKGMAKKVGSSFSKSQLNAAIRRGLERGIGRVAAQIVRDLT